jgi:hypothetical protein
MKKTLRLILLAVAAVALLTSCDAILESMFPDETGHGTHPADNTLTFEVTGYNNYDNIGDYGGWGYYNGQRTYAGRNLYLKVTAPDLTVSTYIGSFQYNDQYTYTETFPALTSLQTGTYTFQLWYDVDGDGTPDLESNSTFNGWYYTNYAYLNGNYVSQIFLDNGANVTVQAYLYDYPYIY